MPDQTLTLTIAYDPPPPPPDSGHAWPEQDDWPGVIATVALPATVHQTLRPDLRAAETCCDETLSAEWGEYDHGARPARVTQWRRFVAPTLEAAEAAARAWHAEGVEVIAGVIARRQARLAQRAATIAAAHARPGSIEIPE